MSSGSGWVLYGVLYGGCKAENPPLYGGFIPRMNYVRDILQNSNLVKEKHRFWDIVGHSTDNTDISQCEIKDIVRT